jgi:O-antigen ligase
MDLICPVIAIISAYSFLHALESRVRSVLFFLVGLAGTLLSQSRGAEIPLLIVLAIICIGLAKTSKRSAYLFISGFMAFILLVGAIVGTVGAGRIWLVFNRGNTESFVEGSGRVDSAKVVIQYCMTHPLGMGYVTGLRSIEKLIPDQSSHMISNMGGADNSYMEVLADSGWLGLALYLLIIGETVALGWHFAKKHSLETLAPDREVHHAIRCALLLLFYCLVNGMDSSEYVLPLRAGFYVQNIILAIILGASASMLIASRTRYAFSAK